MKNRRCLVVSVQAIDIKAPAQPRIMVHSQQTSTQETGLITKASRIRPREALVPTITTTTLTNSKISQQYTNV